MKNLCVLIALVGIVNAIPSETDGLLTSALKMIKECGDNSMFLCMKVLTNAERKKRYIDKLKADGKYEDFLKKKANDERSRQHRIKIGLEQLPKAVRERTKRVNREYIRRNVVKCRARKKEIRIKNESQSGQPSVSAQVTSEENGPYKTKGAWVKAVGKVKRSLPSASAKKKFIVTKVLRMFDNGDVSDMVNQTHSNKIPKKKGLAPDIVDEVKMFYERDDISRISPNMKDCRKFKDPVTGTIDMKQIRYLMYRLSDVHQLFLRHMQNDNDEQNVQVGLSKFSSLRPSHVKLASSTPLDQCLCLYHTNFINCCKALHQNMPQFPIYGEELERLLLCENPTKNCWYRSCKKCVDAKKTVNGILKNSGKKAANVAMWSEWKKNKDSNRFQESLEKGTLKNLISHFHDILPDFLKHSFIKRSQAAQFEKDSKEVSQSQCDIASLQIDFAESYNCEAQSEIQSAHWNQASV